MKFVFNEFTSNYDNCINEPSFPQMIQHQQGFIPQFASSSSNSPTNMNDSFSNSTSNYENKHFRTTDSEPEVGKTKKRKKSTEKERQRNLEIKAALSTLGKSMPYVNKDLSRIRTLRLAREYIDHLRRILENEMHTGQHRPLDQSDFERVVMQEMQTNNSYKNRAEMEILSESGQSPTFSMSPLVSTSKPQKRTYKKKKTTNDYELKQQTQATPANFKDTFCVSEKEFYDLNCYIQNYQ